jgi:hypothetical protein
MDLLDRFVSSDAPLVDASSYEFLIVSKELNC